MPPLQKPEKSFVIGFSDQARVEAMPKPEIPTGFYKLPQTFVTTGAPIVLPKFSEEVDADACLAIVIGKAGKRIQPAQAWDHVAGVTLLIDITARDINRREGLTTNNLLGKNFPSSTSLGPAMLVQPTRKELEEMEVELSIDGSVKQKFTLRDCVFTVEQIIARWSILGIKPGDFLAIGASMALQGDRLQNPVPLKTGVEPSLLLAGDRRAIPPGRAIGRSTSMKLVTFTHQDQERIGAVDDAGHIVDLERAYAGYLREAEGIPHADQLAAVVLGREMCEFLQRGEKSLAAAQKALTYANTKPNNANAGMIFDRQQVRLMAPVPRARRAGIRGKELFRSRRRNGVKKGPHGSRGLSQAPRHGDRPRRRYPPPAGSEKFGLRGRARHRHRQALRRRE